MVSLEYPTFLLDYVKTHNPVNLHYSLYYDTHPCCEPHVFHNVEAVFEASPHSTRLMGIPYGKTSPAVRVFKIVGFLTFQGMEEIMLHFRPYQNILVRL